ncbi:DNA topoisomerase IV subunit A [Actinomycetaceae bacterium TAE3-ERU4]|nr:DNA topoisomerase IV subunit A [Actinomycetaceae bacterium TAE3-ERU4]
MSTLVNDSATTVLDTDVSLEMERSFLEYAYSVIYSRALPDARDGLKPVQRRIIYQMSQMGLRPDKGHVKSQRVVGDVMGKLHPHGDSAIYDALVRMAQDFSMRVPLVDGHGNFGSLDDGPAAPRYTEARMALPATDMVSGLDEDVVDFVPNYDSQFMQPSVLPAAYPNLLVNGASGIAVGMATNIAPHNLGEVCRAACYLLDNPQATVDDLMRYIPGPDLPTGGTIVGLEGIREAYETGRGAFKSRAKVNIERITARKMGLVVTELPYLVGPERVIEKIKDSVNSGKVKGISAVTNLTDRHHGLRLVIEIKNGFNPEAVLAALYKHTPMQDSFSINSVALVNGQPQTLGLKELLQVYLRHRMDVVLRRTKFRLDKRLDRLHLVEGLLIAVLDIDDVIAIIRSSEDSATAKVRLMDIFDLSDIQADHILSLQLRRLTKLAQIELENEKTELIDEISRLRLLLDNEDARRELVGNELREVASRLGSARRTVLLAEDSGTVNNDVPLEIKDKPCHLLLTPAGSLARIDTEDPLSFTGPRVPHDVILSVLNTTTRSTVGILDDSGSVHKLDVLTVPALPPSADAPSLAGATPANLLVQSLENKPVALVDLSENAAPLALATNLGTVKRVRPEHPLTKEIWEIISLSDSTEKVVAAAPSPDENTLVFITSDAQLLRFEASLVRPQGISASGMQGISLKPGASLISFTSIPTSLLEESYVLTVTKGEPELLGEAISYAKVTSLSLYPPKGRATQGVRCHRFLSGQSTLYGAWITKHMPRAVDKDGNPVDLPSVSDKRDGSGAAVPREIFAAN